MSWRAIVLVNFLMNACMLGSVQAENVPKGFRISILARVPEARSMSVCGNTLFVGTSGDAVYSVPLDGQGGVKRVAHGLVTPNGVACHAGHLYVAMRDRVSAWPLSPTGALVGEPTDIITGLPTEAHHGRRYIRFGPDDKLYLSIGTPCNICSPQGLQGSILRMNPDGSNQEVIATGLRNSVGFDWHPSTRSLFFTDNGADGMGNNRPPDELNEARQVGGWYGFPYFGGTDRLPGFETKAPPREQTSPVFNFPAHAATLGIHFYRGSMFPHGYRGSAFVAEHNDWNRSAPGNYRIVQLNFREGEPMMADAFVTGLGPPVDIKELLDGSLVVSSDVLGVIYRITYNQ
jgi:glucose/arabinose dehydrogenase